MTIDWKESQEFWGVFEEVLFDPLSLSQTPYEVKQVVKLLKLRPTARVLDLACGFGQHSLVLAEKGFKVTGVDANPNYLARARTLSTGKAHAPEWVESDMRDFIRSDSFDAILSLYTSFGYFEDEADDAMVLRNACISLKSGGTFLLDLPGKELIAREFITEAKYQTPSGVRFVARRAPVQNWSRVLNSWTLSKDGREYAHTFEQTLFGGYEISLSILPLNM